MLHEILTITNSHIGCYISYKYLYKQITSLKEFPNSYHTYCIDQNIDCSVDYEKVWDECQKNKGPILNNEYTQYFYCEQLLMVKTIHVNCLCLFSGKIILLV